LSVGYSKWRISTIAFNGFANSFTLATSPQYSQGQMHK
jgi:hypothetical protein